MSRVHFFFFQHFDSKSSASAWPVRCHLAKPNFQNSAEHHLTNQKWAEFCTPAWQNIPCRKHTKGQQLSCSLHENLMIIDKHHLSFSWQLLSHNFHFQFSLVFNLFTCTINLHRSLSANSLEPETFLNKKPLFPPIATHLVPVFTVPQIFNSITLVSPLLMVAYREVCPFKQI